MEIRLISLDGGPDIIVDGLPVLVGRHPQCDVRIDSIRVSRRHCYLAEADGSVVVRDLGSANGTRINGRRVVVGRLRPGDGLSIAAIRYRVVHGWGDEATRAGHPGDPEVGRSSPRRGHPWDLGVPPEG
jgi:predicted component of type VI protein secretion system